MIFLNRLAGSLSALAFAAGGLAVTPKPVEAQDVDDLLRFLLGAASVAIIVDSWDEARADDAPRYLGRTLPGFCMERMRGGGELIRTYNARCLSQAGLRDLPESCARTVRTDRGPRPVFDAGCLRQAGYLPEGEFGRDGAERGWSEERRWDSDDSLRDDRRWGDRQWGSDPWAERRWDDEAPWLDQPRGGDHSPWVERRRDGAGGWVDGAWLERRRDDGQGWGDTPPRLDGDRDGNGRWSGESGWDDIGPRQAQRQPDDRGWGDQPDLEDRQSSAPSRPVPRAAPPGRGEPSPNVPPQRSDAQQDNTLPEQCALAYRVGEQRVQGYYSDCLARAGVRDLPEDCSLYVQLDDERHRIYRSECLRSEGWRAG